MSTSVNQPNIPVPDLNLLFQNKGYQIKTEINCIAVGTVLSMDTADQTVNVKVNYLRVIYGGVAQSAPNSDAVNNQTQPYPQILKCPLMISAGGTSYLTFPVVAGDQCVILFNDRDLDTWWQTGSSNSAPNSSRVHDLNDALVFVGVRSLATSLTLYNTLGPQLYGPTGVCLKSQLTTLRIALDALCAALLAFVDSDGDTLSPATAAAITAAQVLIDGVLI